MTDSSDSSGPHDGSRPQQAPRPAGSGFFAWLRGTGIVRSDERWFAGVAGGIAAKAGLDPLIIRGAFVVLALLGGPGLLLYAAGWLLLPDGAGKINLEEIFRGRAPNGLIAVVAIIAAVVVLPIVFGTVSIWGWDVWRLIGVPGWLTATVGALFWIAVTGGVVYWVVRALGRRGTQGAASGGAASGSAASGSAPDAPGAGDSPSAADTTDFEGEPSFVKGPAGSGAHPSGDRAGEWSERVNERVTEWSERAGAWGERVSQQTEERARRRAAELEARKLGAGHTLLTLALALIAAGAAAIWVLQVSPAVSSEVERTGAVPAAVFAALIAGVAVLAVSLIVAGIRGKHTGWVGFLSFCGVVALLVTTVLPWGTRFYAFGNTGVSAGDRGIVMLAGNARIDLTDLDAHESGGATGDPEDLRVWMVAGNAHIELPRHAPVIIELRMLAGNTTVHVDGDAGGRISGPFISRTAPANLPAGMTVAAARDAGVPTVRVTMAAGNARIESAPGDPAAPTERGARTADQRYDRESTRITDRDAQKETAR